MNVFPARRNLVVSEIYAIFHLLNLGGGDIFLTISLFITTVVGDVVFALLVRLRCVAGQAKYRPRSAKIA